MVKSTKKFQLAAQLKSDDEVHALDSNAIASPPNAPQYGEKVDVWAYFQRVPYKAQILSIHKSDVRGKPEYLYFLTWYQFKKDWDTYVWESDLIPDSPDVHDNLLSKQRTAFQSNTSSTSKRKRRSASAAASAADGNFNPSNNNNDTSNNNNNNGADDDHNGSDADDDDHSDDGRGKSKKSAAPGDELRSPIFNVIDDVPLHVQARMRRPGIGSDASGSYVPQDVSLIQLAMPRELIDLLVRGQAWVKDAGFVLPLPRRPSVVDILNEFVRDGNEVDHDNRLSSAQAFVSIFDACFPLLLLYKNERLQFERLKPIERRGPSTVYGAEHLLRFVTRAPEVFATVPMEREVVVLYERMLNALILFLKAKRFDYFLSA